MTGAARSYGALTITNALPTGIGCAVGIELPVDARVSLSTQGPRKAPTLRVAAGQRTRLVELSLRAGLSTYFPETNAVATLSLRSKVPVRRGLKSSSAVSTAILRATARAAGTEPSSLELGRLSAEVSRRAGVSATGALDDALAGLTPGFVVTDNLLGEVLRRSEVDPSWAALLYIPSRPHPPSPRLRTAFSKEHRAGELSVRAALEGDWARAMELNSELVERTMGYSYRDIRHRLLSHGALASGVSGLGPTLATIAPRAQLDELASLLPSDRAEKRLVPFVRGNGSRGAGP